MSAGVEISEDYFFARRVLVTYYDNEIGSGQTVDSIFCAQRVVERPGGYARVAG